MFQSTQRFESELRDLGSLDLKISPNGAKAVVEALQQAHLSLPGSGSYVARAENGKIHIYEMGNGISEFDFQGPQKVDMRAGTVELTLGRPGLDKIVLHGAPGNPDPQAVDPRSALSAGLRTDLDTLKKLGGALTDDQVLRMGDIVRQIRDVERGPNPLGSHAPIDASFGTQVPRQRQQAPPQPAPRYERRSG